MENENNERQLPTYFPAICPNPDCRYEDPARPIPEICPMCGQEKEIRTIG